MNYNGMGPGMFPQQGQGGMGPQGPQGPQPGQQMPQAPPQQMGGGEQGGITGPGSGAWMQAQADNRSGLADRLNAARSALQQGQIMGFDPMRMQQLQQEVLALERQAQSMMGQQQQGFNRMTASNMAPGIGGARPNTSNPGYYAASQNNDIEMQILASMFGLGGGGRGQGGGGMGAP